MARGDGTNEREEGGARGLLRRAGARQLVVYGLAAVAAVALVVTLGDEAAHHVKELERRLDELGPWTPVAFVASMVVLTTVFVPDTLLALVAGALFGLGRGTLLVACGGFLAAALQYALARRWLAGLATRLVATRPALAGVQTAVRQDQLRMQLLLRLTPLSPTLVTYVVSAAGVRFGPFLLACVALVPIWFTQVYLAYVGRHLAVQASRAGGVSWVDDGVVVLGLVALIGVVVLVSRAAQRAIAAAAGPR